MCPSEDRCLECDWGLQQRRQPASLCHLCGCSPTTGFDYLLLLECEIWICLFITQSLACVGAWATADDCLVVAVFSLSLSLSVLCFDLSLVCALVVLGIMRSSNSGAFCKQGRKVDALMFCFRNRNDGPLFGFVCLGEGLKWFQKLLVALSCISLNEKLFQQPSIEVYVLVKILVTLVEIQLQLFIFIHFASFADNCTFSTVYYRNAQFPLLVYYFPMREHRKKTHSLTWLDRSVLASI